MGIWHAFAKFELLGIWFAESAKDPAMNIDAIRALLLAAELGSFSAASKQLGVPPSTVSRKVSELEKDLGRPVLVRSGRGVTVASEAQDTFAQLREVLLAVEACYQLPAPLKYLRVTSPVEMGFSLLPSLLPEFRAAFPEVVVEIRGESRVLGIVEEGFDLAIRAGKLGDSNCLFRRFSPNPFFAVASPAVAENIRSVEQLAVVPTIEAAGPTPGLIGRWNGEPFSIRSPSVAKFDSFSAAIPLILAGHAYAAMPLHVVRDHLTEGRLKRIPEVELDAPPLHAVYPQRHRHQSAISSFIDAVASELCRR